MMFLTILGGFVGVVAMMVISSLLRGYALSVLWGWFMVPTLGLPALSVVQAIGIAIVISFLTYQYNDCQKKEKSFGETVGQASVMAVVYPLGALLFGWVIHQFM